MQSPPPQKKYFDKVSRFYYNSFLAKLRVYKNTVNSVITVFYTDIFQARQEDEGKEGLNTIKLVTPSSSDVDLYIYI